MSGALVTEQDFREQTVAKLATLTEAVDGLKGGVADLRDAIEKADLKGYKCRAEVDAAITQVRLDLEQKVGAMKSRYAYISGSLGLIGVMLAILLR